MATLLIKDCDWLVTQNQSREVIRDASVLVENGTIREIGRIGSSADKTIDARKQIALPGLINAHTHLAMALFRGFADDMLLQDWLQKKIWPVEAALTDDDCYYGALLGCAEMIRSGTTSFVDMYYHMERVADAVNQAGLRGFLAHAPIDLFDPAKCKLEEERLVKYHEYLQKLAIARIKFVAGPHAPYTCSADLLRFAKNFAEKTNSIFHTHVAETRREQADMMKLNGMRVVEYLDKIGVLSQNTLAAHCVWLTKNEVKLLARSGASVAHCPVSNMKLAGGGVTPLPEMFESGIAVGLGTDGAASNNSLNMFETMKICALIHKAYRWDPTVLNAQRALDLATIEGARAIKAEDQLGSLEVGKRADIILIDCDAPNMQPIHGERTIISDLVYSVSDSNVNSTIVDGNILMLNREMKTLNLPQVITATQQRIDRLLRN